MSAMFRAIRRASLVVCGVVSLVAAVLLAERIIRPGIIEDFGTVALVGLLALFLLPPATLLALRHDRRQVLIAVGRERAEEAARFLADVERANADTGLGMNGAGMNPGDAVDFGSDLRAVRHGAHDRGHSHGVSAGRGAEGPSVPGTADRLSTDRASGWQPVG